jgi:hypothetical protein
MAAKSVVDDPYRFPPVLGDLDVWLLGEGTHLRPFEVMGATQRRLHGVAGTAFAVWAPNASRVSVVGDFNHWTVGATRCGCGASAASGRSSCPASARAARTSTTSFR